MTDIALRVGATRFGGWKALSVALSMRSAAGSFTFSATDKSPGDPVARPIHKGDAAEVLFGDEPLVTGWIDAVRTRYDERSHTLTAEGRDAAADLWDCSVVHEPGEWRGRSVLAIAQAIAEPFGVPVTAAAPVGAPFAVFKAEPGEGAYEAIKRAAAYRALLPISDGQGGLVLTQVGTDRVPAAKLELGVNIASGEAVQTDRERYSLYRLVGQRREVEDDTETGAEEASAIQGEAQDPAITRYRPRVIVSSGGSTPQELADLAAWELATRRGRALSATYVVRSWEHEGGVWRPNTLIPVTDPRLAIRGEMLVTDVTLALSEAGRTATLVVMPPEAYALRAEPEPPEEPAEEVWR